MAPKTQKSLKDGLSQTHEEVDALKASRARILVRLVNAISRACVMNSARSTHFFGMSMNKIIVLGELFRHNGCRQDELCELVFIDKGSITRAVQQLQEYGLVERQQDPSDRRSVRVYLTRKALAMERKMFVIASEWGGSLTDGFTPEERETVIDLLLRMEANARAMVKNAPEQEDEA